MQFCISKKNITETMAVTSSKVVAPKRCNRPIHQVLWLLSLLSLFQGIISDEAIFLDGYQDAISLEPLHKLNTWGRTADFAVEIWFRPERKEKDDHEEQCLLSQGSWEGRFKLSVLPWRTVRFTVRNHRGGVVDCDGDVPLQPQRWYHIGASYDTTNEKSVLLTLNGDKVATTCNPSHAVSSLQPANGFPKPMLIGCCLNPSQPNGGDHISGTISDVRYWFEARSLIQFQSSMHSKLLPPHLSDSALLWCPLTRLKKKEEKMEQIGSQGVVSGIVGDVVHSSKEIQVGNSQVKIYGEPKWTSAMRGDQMLSALLTG
jgi:hypothetical protein